MTKGKVLKFCYKCGGELEVKFIEGHHRRICSICGIVNYENPIPSVAVVITDLEGRVLLTKRNIEPGIGLWCLPGGFIELGETAEETVVRETLEETGLGVEPVKMLGPCSRIGGYHGDVLLLGFTASVIDGDLKPGDDAEEVRYFNLNELPEIAFQCHIYFIQTAFGVELSEPNLLK